MEPQIQYAKTEDDVSIAYWTIGEGGGTPLLMTAPAQWPHISLELGIPRLRAWYEHLAQDRTVIRYDARGHGMSQRDIGEFAMEHTVLDLAAVIERLGLERLDLAGFYGPGWAVVAYAAEHPERVRKLVLWQLVTRPKAAFASPQGQALLALLERDWDTYTETMTHNTLDWRPGRLAHEWAAFIRQSTTQENERKIMTVVSQREFDFSILRTITADTLIVTVPASYQATPGAEDYARDLASGIANSRIVVVDGPPRAAWDIERGTAAVDAFLGTAPRAHDQRQPADAAAQAGLTVILFADIADSTALTERLGDTPFREKARALDEALRRAIASNGGTAIEGKLLGDGVLAVFGAAREAIACASEMHRLAGEVGGHDPRSATHDALSLHVGIHAGDVIRERAPDGRENVYGGAVNIAARVAGEAGAAETLVSATVRDLARTSAGVAFQDRGERELKGVSEPVRVWAVQQQ